ncbi:hypothetical protein CU044_7623 [Streptomyces sp. L-9-10]|nr:hypothetical protein CU044_7623 [Streptomyces sp. L-9-10]
MVRRRLHGQSLRRGRRHGPGPWHGTGPAPGPGPGVLPGSAPEHFVAHETLV